MWSVNRFLTSKWVRFRLVVVVSRRRLPRFPPTDLPRDTLGELAHLTGESQVEIISSVVFPLPGQSREEMISSVGFCARALPSREPRYVSQEFVWTVPVAAVRSAKLFLW